ncbi:hypothetical protein EV177_009371 [Coemansia sp. RSA 1804]|nr:hypothetical protein EV177_009371 [Coemansia sp. RSA 1804]
MGTPLLLGSATTPGTPSTPSGSSAAMSTLLPPHRVDRQMAASGARPLLFVRPQPKEAAAARRRKRRCVSAKCVSSTASAPASDSFCESGPPLPLLTPGAAARDDDAMSSFSSNFEQNTLQWQRISEQRRRDAMRENFDLLKRMLPQSYMDSDDGRELARPVLLARFLRWVDDTLIEMEGLKTEVAQLRSQMHLFTTAASNSAAATSSSSTIWQSSTTQQPSASSSVLAYYHPVSF